MRVLADPRSISPRAILDELLAPHGLRAEEQAGGVLVVLPSTQVDPAPASVPGSIVAELKVSGDLAPVRGATAVVFAPDPIEVLCAIDGRCVVADLAPGAYSLETRAHGFLDAHLSRVTVEPGRVTRLVIELQPEPYIHDEIVIQSSQLSLLQAEPAAPISIGRSEMERVPHLGGDLFRALSLLPGITANDVSARFSIHGGRRDEVAVVLDGQELYDTFHLKDYDGALSAVPAKNLAGANLITGALDASYGDRMGGALDLTTIQPRTRRTLLGLSSIDALLQGSGLLPEDRGSWLVSVRRGFLDLAGRAIGTETPALWDLLAKLEFRLGDRQLLWLRTLATGDDLDFEEVDADGGFKRLQNDYDDRYVWLRHQGVLGDSLLVESGLSRTRITRDRNGTETDDKGSFEVADERRTDIEALSQTWSVAPSRQHLLRWGWQVRDYDATFDYRNLINPEFELESSWTATRDGENRFRGDLRSRHTELWVTDRFAFREALTVELGARYDHHSLPDESLVSPRASLAWTPGSNRVLRASWGLFRQSQRPFELQVEDGLETLAPSELARHWVVGWEQLFSQPGAVLRALRLELFDRRVENSRIRFENALEQINTLPEIEPDRIRVVPDSSAARGVEAVVRGSLGSRTEWWIVYSYAKSTDEIEGRRTSRQTDQPQALAVNLNLAPGSNWNVHFAWRYHTGWPTTPVTATTVEDDGELEVVPVLGDLNSERLPAYHRLDLRASRSWRLRGGVLEFFIDVQNLYDRNNVAGFDLGIDEEGLGITLPEEHWPGIFPSVGISFEF
ncbi:MAG: TonB-dependent receptor [Thermoanaerobaculia bacterium]